MQLCILYFLDNVTLSIDAVLYLRVIDPYLASYGVEDAEFAIIQVAQTTMRSELGKISLDKVFREREELNVSIVDSINKASEAWGIKCMRYEIRKWHEYLISIALYDLFRCLITKYSFKNLYLRVLGEKISQSSRSNADI